MLGGSGGRARTCALAGNSRASYRLDHAGTTEAAGLEPARRRAALRRSKALPFPSAMLPAEGEGIEPPRPSRAHPFSRRDTAPLAVLPKWLRQASNLQPSD